MKWPPSHYFTNRWYGPPRPPNETSPRQTMFGSADDEDEDKDIALRGRRREQRRGLPDSQLRAVPGSATSEPGRSLQAGVSPSAQVQEWLDLLEHPTRMLHFAARTHGRYKEGENPEGLPTFSILCGDERGLLLAKLEHSVKVRSWKGFSKLAEH